MIKSEVKKATEKCVDFPCLMKSIETGTIAIITEEVRGQYQGMAVNVKESSSTDVGDMVASSSFRPFNGEVALS